MSLEIFLFLSVGSLFALLIQWIWFAIMERLPIARDSNTWKNARTAGILLSLINGICAGFLASQTS